MTLTAEQLLKSTIEYYSVDPMARRCVNGISNCYYSPVTAKRPTSEGCAIGRHLKPEVQLAFDKEIFSLSISTIWENEKKRAMLPEWMIKLGSDFLSMIQTLHDTPENWAEKGLTEAGKQAVNYIIKRFQLDMPMYVVMPTVDGMM